MFEGQFKGAVLRDQRETKVLRQFRWTDLVAKIAANRDLREELERVEGGFNAFAEARRELAEESKPIVNHEDLSHGKASRLSLGDAAENAVQGDREKE